MSSLPSPTLTEVPSGTVSLSGVLISEVVRAIVSQERSGDLIVESGASARKVMFDRGFIVFASSNLDELRFGDLLVKAGTITQAQLQTALELVKQEGCRIGKAIEIAGLLSPDEVAATLTDQISAIATSIYSLREGTYRFDEHPCRIPEELRVGVSVYRVQLEGVRSAANLELIETTLGSLSRFVKATETPPFRIEDISLEPEEIQARETASRPLTLENLVNQVGNDRSSALRTVYGLLSSGLLEPSEAPRERAEEPATSFAPSSVSRETQPDAVSASAPGPMAAPTSDNKEEITRLFNEIKIRQMVQDREGVVSMLRKVVHLAPDNPKYVGMLAKALGALPKEAKKAEPAFRRALSLDPENAQLHYDFALYYRSMGMPSRALAELKTALRIDPGLAEARRAVVELKQKDEGAFTKSLRKLFS